MRTSFHHQPEAQHPKSPAIETPAGRLPHLLMLWTAPPPARGRLADRVAVRERHIAAFAVPHHLGRDWTTKDQSLQNARILRSSSTGFLLMVDRKILLIPNSELKQISSSAQIPKN
jgi:hypothetical protein